MSEAQAALAAFFRAQANWREQKAFDYPNDHRNERAADTLRELAHHLDGLHPDDPRTAALDHYAHLFGAESLELGGLDHDPEPQAARLGFSVPRPITPSAVTSGFNAGPAALLDDYLLRGLAAQADLMEEAGDGLSADHIRTIVRRLGDRIGSTQQTPR